MIIYCKKCRGEFEFEDGADFSAFRCPDCGGEFTAEKPAPPSAPPKTAPAQPPAAHALPNVPPPRNCPNCGRRLSWRSVICPGCGIQLAPLKTDPSIASMTGAGCLVIILWTIFTTAGIWVFGAAIFGGIFAANRPAAAQTQQAPPPAYHQTGSWQSTPQK